MPYKLTVTRPFGNYAIGDDITDASEIGKIGFTHNAVRVWVPEPEPEQAPAPAPARGMAKAAPAPSAKSDKED